MKLGRTRMGALAVATAAAVAALAVTTTAGATTASGSNTVFVHGGGVSAQTGYFGTVTLASGSNTVFVHGGGGTGARSVDGTGGGTSTPPAAGGTGI